MKPKYFIHHVNEIKDVVFKLDNRHFYWYGSTIKKWIHSSSVTRIFRQEQLFEITEVEAFEIML